MARRSDHSRDEIKEMAIQKGSEIVAKEGLSSLTARKLASEIGYTVGTLYNVFKNYDDLVVHINAQTVDALAHQMAELLTETNEKTPFSSIIHTMAFGYYHFARTQLNQWNSVFGHDIAKEDLPEWYQQKTGALFTMLENILIQHAPQLTTEQASLHAKTLWASIHGMCDLGLNGKLELVDANHTETLIETFLENYALLEGQ